jgi:hypothetical protein
MRLERPPEAAPSIVNSSAGRTREYLTSAEVERLMATSPQLEPVRPSGCDHDPQGRRIRQILGYALRKPSSLGVVACRGMSCPGGIALIRATLVRALVLSAAFAGSLMSVRCLAEHDYQLPAKATKELSPQLLSLLQQKNMPKHSRILVRIFKEESELESGSRTPPAISRSSRSIRSAGGQATLGRRFMRATVRLPRASIRLRRS